MNINAKHTLLIFAEMIFNDFKRSFSIHSSHWGDVPHGGQHRNATVFDLGGATSLEVLHASVGGETGGIPETHRRLHAEFILECAQRRCCVIGPVSPGASGQTILGHRSCGRDQKHRVPVSRLFMILENHGMSWCETKGYNMIQLKTCEADLMWYWTIWYDMVQNEMLWYAMVQYEM